MTIPTNTVASNGIGVISDDQANTYVQTDQTVAQLRGFVGKSGMAVMLQGIAAAGDGGAGLFYWSSGSFTDDGVNTIVPSAAAGQGAWLRATQPVKLATCTIAAGPNQLPTASALYAGFVAYVTDFSGSPTYHGAIGAGGGSTGTPVFCNGSAWLTD